MKRRGAAPRWARPAVDAAMTVLLILQMAPYQTGGVFHEYAGMAFVALFVAHHALNAGWLGRALRQRNLRSWITIGLDCALALSVIGLAVSGILMSRHALPFLMQPGLAHLSRPLHALFGYASLIVTSLHVGMHVPALRGYGRMAVGGKGGPGMPHPLSVALRAACVALGIYAFVRLNVAAKLTMGLSFPDGMTPLPLLLGLHLALAAGFVVLGSLIDEALRHRR